MKTQIRNLLNIGRAALPRRRTTGRSSLPAFIAAALLLSTITYQPSTAFAQGSLTPPGAPGPTMLTLSQVEPRTPISSVPFVIRQPGSYYLTTNINSTTGDAIDIATNGVTISSTLNPANGIAIGFDTGVSDVTILNGHIVSGVTNNAGVYGGSGFGYGIYGSSGSRIRVVGVSVVGCLYDGINVGGASTVESCTVQTVGGNGIVAGDISHSQAEFCGGIAIDAGQSASDCYGDCSGTSYGIYTEVANNCYGASTGGDGLEASTANNCYAFTASSGNTALYADNANNCDGEAFGGGSGLVASTASSCFGSSTTGYGINATDANNCFGQSSYSDGIFTYIASGCYGESFDTGYGIYAVEIATGCFGYSSSGTGLHAVIGESCSGTSLNITHNLNSY